MKTVKEIKNKMHENREKISELSARLENSFKTLSSADIAKISDEITTLKLENTVLYDNARRAVVSEFFPAVLAVWNKHAGKKYGDKTREKIRLEIKDAVKVSFYITVGGKYGADCAHIMPLNDNGYNDMTFNYNDFDLYTFYNGAQMLSADNVIQAITGDAFRFSGCPEYVENIAHRVQELKKTYQAVRAAADKLNALISDFNAINPSKIKELDRVYTANSSLIY